MLGAATTSDSRGDRRKAPAEEDKTCRFRHSPHVARRPRVVNRQARVVDDEAVGSEQAAVGDDVVASQQTHRHREEIRQHFLIPIV